MTPLEFLFCLSCCFPLVGFAFMFSLCAGCQCHCTDCCSDSAPDEFEVEITLVDDECGTCDSFLSGTYVLSRLALGYYDAACIWEFEEGEWWRPTGEGDLFPPSISLCDPGCATLATCTYIYYRKVTVEIFCVSDTEYKIKIEAYVAGHKNPPDVAGVPTWLCGGPACTYNLFFNSWKWEKTVARADFDCAAAAGEEVEFVSSVAQSVAPGTSPCGAFCGEFWLCDSAPGSVFLTAV